jgi:ELWxxDGT repeat protein
MVKTGSFILLFFLNFFMVQFCLSQRYHVELVKDINETGSSYVQNIVIFKDKLVFAAGNQVYGLEPWISDGTGAGTVMIKNINVQKNSPDGDDGSNPGEFTPVGDQVFFTANDQVHWYELWRTDGTAAGTQMVKDLRPGDFGSNPHDLVPYNNRVVLSADEGYGEEPFISDGTPGGTYMIRNINTASSYPNYFFDYKGIVYFTARDNYTGDELWRTDGTEQGTYLVRDINPLMGQSSTPHFFTIFNDSLFFAANSDNFGWELCRTDGTYYGTTVFARADTSNTMGSYPINLFVYNNRLYFNADDWIHGRELWSVSANPADIMMVKDINPQGNSDPYYFTTYNGLLYFNASDSHGKELWVTDGTQQGTRMVTDLNPYGDSNPQLLTVFDNKLFFAASGQLWYTDGTAAGTKQLGSDTSDLTNHFVSNLIVYHGCLFFSAEYDSLGKELYKVVVNPNSVADSPPGHFMLSVFPNPCSDMIQVSFERPEIDSRLEIVDQHGVTVYKSILKKGTAGPLSIGTSMLKKGLYCLCVISGPQRAAVKFIRE